MLYLCIKVHWNDRAKCACTVHYAQSVYGPPQDACNGLHALALAEAASSLNSSLATAPPAAHDTTLLNHHAGSSSCSNSKSCPVFQSLLLRLMQFQAAAEDTAAAAGAVQFSSTSMASSSIFSSGGKVVLGLPGKGWAATAATAVWDGPPVGSYLKELLLLLQEAALGSQVRIAIFCMKLQCSK